jgi:hypothetical protein
MTEDEFATLMRFMGAAINRPISGETAEAWFQMLCDIPYKLAKAAFMKVLAEHEFANLPPVGLIRRAALEIKAGPTITAAQGWGMVMRAIREYGHYREAQALDALPENVAQVVRWMGWGEICQSDSVDVIRAQFMRMYDTQVNRQKELAIMPPDVRELMGAVGGALEMPADRKLLETEGMK